MPEPKLPTPPEYLGRNLRLAPRKDDDGVEFFFFRDSESHPGCNFHGWWHSHQGEV